MTRTYPCAGSRPGIDTPHFRSRLPLSFGLDHDHDAFLSSGVGHTCVLRGQLVDDLPRRVALEPFGDPPTDDNGLERVVDGRDGQHHPRITAQIACFARARAGEEDGPVAVGAEKAPESVAATRRSAHSGDGSPPGALHFGVVS
jgi:hypothetical protein